MSKINKPKINLSEQSSRLEELDFVRGLSILGVVIIHITGAYLAKLDTNSASYSIFITLNQAQRFCVPAFFLMSGFLLSYKKRHCSNLDEVLKNRLSKILCPYIIWSSLFEIYYNFILRRETASLWVFLEDLITGRRVYVFYFIIVLLQLYLLWWALAKFKVRITAKILALAFAIQLTFTIYNYLALFGYVATPHYLSDRLIFGWIFYFILGMYLAVHAAKTSQKFILNWKISSSKTLAILSLIFWLFSLAEFYAIKFLFHNHDFAISCFKVSSQIFAVTTFFLLISVSFKHLSINFLSQYSFPIYLIHAPILNHVVFLCNHFFFEKMVLPGKVYISFVCANVLLLGVCFLFIKITLKILPKKAIKYVWGI